MEALFLQLIAAKLISIERRHSKPMWTITKQMLTKAFPPFYYENDISWVGIYLVPPNKNRQYALDNITIDK